MAESITEELKIATSKFITLGVGLQWNLPWGFLLKPIPRPIVFIEGIEVLMLPFSLLKLEDQFDQTP